MTRMNFCWRCMEYAHFPAAIERHHCFYGADWLTRTEVVGYLCSSCHEAITDINRFLWGAFQDVFGRDAEKREWPHARAWVYARFLKEPERDFSAVASIKEFVRESLDAMAETKLVRSA